MSHTRQRVNRPKSVLARALKAKCAVRIAAFAVVMVLTLQMANGQQTAQNTPLTLQQALSIALEKNPARKIALAEEKAASARGRSSVGSAAARRFLRNGHAQQ